MKPKNTGLISIIFISVIVILFSILIAGCNQKEENVSGGFSTISPVGARKTPIVTPLLASVETQIAASGYMSGCADINPLTYHEQVGYLGIFPGISNVTEVKSLLGTPEEVGNITTDSISYGYNESDVVIDFREDNVVQYIVTAGDEVKKTVRELVLQYGCPNVIFGFDSINEEVPLGTYSTLYFMYLDLGFELIFDREFDAIIDKISLSLEDQPDYIIYFTPISLDEYVRSKEGLISNPKRGRPFSWSEIFSE